ncbi:MAG: hypothetical protein ABIO70_14680 [Pseudomonadota bacterium]
MSWDTRAAANLLPLGVERTRLATALREWVYEGNVEDLEAPVESCEICEHPGIRYQFEIVNRHNGNALQIGSECIKRFSIEVLDARGGVLVGRAAHRKVDADRRTLEQQARTRSVLNSLVELAAADDKFELDNFIAYYARRGAFTPAQMALLQWRFARHQVEHRPADFKVSLRRLREQSQLLAMPDWKAKRLWPYLSVQQRQWYEGV